MSTDFPTRADAFPDPGRDTRIDDPAFTLDKVITNLQDAVEAVESYVLAGGSGSAALPWVNVIAYGADKTGVNDSATAFRNAITAAGNGGTVIVPSGTYRINSTLTLPPGARLRGMGREYTALNYYGTGAAIQKATPLTTTSRHNEVSGMQIANPGGTGTVGLDARGFTRGYFHDLWITGFTTYGIYWGGDFSTYDAGYSNVGERITVENCPTCMYWGGVTSGGATTSNYITVRNCILTPSGTSGIACDMYGDSNMIQGCDISYNTNATGISLRNGAIYCSIRDNRFEGIATVAGKHAVEIAAGASFCAFAGNVYDLNGTVPAINDADVTNNRTVILDTRMRTSQFSTNGALDIGQDAKFRRAIYGEQSNGSLVLDARVTSDANRRFGISVNGSLLWYNPTNGAVNAYLAVNSTSTGVMQWADNSYVAVARVTALPAASATYRGVQLRVEGGTGVADHLYVCIKNASDAYVWQQIV